MTNYNVGDRVRVKQGDMIYNSFVGVTGTIVERYLNKIDSSGDGAIVALDRRMPEFKVPGLFFSESEMEREDNRHGLPRTVQAGDWVQSLNLTHCGIPYPGTPKDKWFTVKKNYDLDKVRFVSVTCPACGDSVEELSTSIKMISYMCTEPSEPDGSYHADLIP